MKHSQLIDLHIHTTYSDGSFSPTEIINMAKEAGLYALSLTDHNSVQAYLHINTPTPGICIIPGVEITVRSTTVLHLLGYGIDVNSSPIVSFLEKREQNRKRLAISAIKEITRKGNQLSTELLFRNLTGFSIKSIMQCVKHVNIPTSSENYRILDQYLREEETYNPTFEEACLLIQNSGGTPILAHPNRTFQDIASLKEELPIMIGQGLLGIEAYHSSFSDEYSTSLLTLAKNFNLHISGGSDFHGKLTPGIHLGNGYGSLQVPYDIIDY